LERNQSGDLGTDHFHAFGLHCTVAILANGKHCILKDCSFYDGSNAPGDETSRQEQERSKLRGRAIVQLDVPALLSPFEFNGAGTATAKLNAVAEATGFFPRLLVV